MHEIPWGAWLVPLVAAAVFAASIRADFVLDDVEIVRDNPALDSPSLLPRLLMSDYWAHVPAADHGLYRPLPLATYALQRWSGAREAHAYHAVNVVLHAVVASLLFFLVRRLARDDRCALVAGLLFAVHPVHTEAVAGIVGRAEILALLFTLGAVLLYGRAFSGAKFSVGAATGSVVCVFAAAASKEWGVVAPAVVLWSQAVFSASRPRLRRDRRAFAVFGGFAAAVAIVLALRAQAVGPRGVHEAFAGATAGDRVLTSLRVAGEYVGLLLAPTRLVADYDAIGTPLSRDPFAADVLISVAALVALVTIAFATRRRRPIVTWGLGVFFGTLLPVSNLLFSVGIVKAERVLYAPSAGFLVAAASGLSWLAARPRTRAFGVSLAAGLVVLGAARTVRSVQDWRDNCTLARATLEEAPESAIFGAIHARCLLDAKRTDEARRVLERVLARRPDFVPALVVAGTVERVEGHEPEALGLFERVLAREPDHRVSLSNAAWLFLRAGRFDRASECYERWRRLAPENPEPVAGLIAALAQSGDLDAAQRAADDGRRRFPADESIRRNAEIVRRLREGNVPP